MKERLEANQERFRSQLKTQRAKHIEEYFESGGAAMPTLLITTYHSMLFDNAVSTIRFAPCERDRTICCASDAAAGC